MDIFDNPPLFSLPSKNSFSSNFVNHILHNNTFTNHSLNNVPLTQNRFFFTPSSYLPPTHDHFMGFNSSLNSNTSFYTIDHLRKSLESVNGYQFSRVHKTRVHKTENSRITGYCQESTSNTYQITRKATKRHWTQEEDRLLEELVDVYGKRKWSIVAGKMIDKRGKQCRERWYNHLRPNIKKDSWSEEEDKVIIQAHSELGSRWSEIVKRLPGRTENSLKNHWNTTRRRKHLKRNKQQRGNLLQEYIMNLNAKDQLFLEEQPRAVVQQPETNFKNDVMDLIPYVDTPETGFDTELTALEIESLLEEGFDEIDALLSEPFPDTREMGFE